VALASPEGREPNAFLEQLRGGVQHAQLYLVQEVVERQPPQVREWLLKSAILDRFNASLAAAVCGEEGAARGGADGPTFVRIVTDENLFVVPLDAHGAWFRYHQLFQELLSTELKRHYSAKSIAGLHVRASEWFQRQGLVDEAAKHARAAAAMSPEPVLVVTPPPPRPTPAAHDGGHTGEPVGDAQRSGALLPGDELSNRELDVVELLAERLQNKEIADRLAIAPHTVNYHLKHIYGKLGVGSRRQAPRRAFELGLIRQPSR
jgi:ATP/maltotriose-dependent transcriptional regulator MalT